jgi:hypothetical protein
MLARDQALQSHRPAEQTPPRLPRSLRRDGSTMTWAARRHQARKPRGRPVEHSADGISWAVFGGGHCAFRGGLAIGRTFPFPAGGTISSPVVKL